MRWLKLGKILCLLSTRIDDLVAVIRRIISVFYRKSMWHKTCMPGVWLPV